MKTIVIGGGGRLGQKIVKRLLDGGHQVTAVVRSGNSPDFRARVLKKDLFLLDKKDLEEADVVISAYGSGFQADPAENRRAISHLARLTRGSGIHLIIVGGAGSLFADKTHRVYIYETPSFPDFLREISRNLKEGLDELYRSEDVLWTMCCPSEIFDYEGSYTGQYLIGESDEPLINKDGQSYISYEDFAKVVVDIAEKGLYKKKRITAVRHNQFCSHCHRNFPGRYFL